MSMDARVEDFRIPAGRVAAAQAALATWGGEDPAAAGDLGDLLGDHDWAVDEDDAGNVRGMAFEGDRYREDEAMLAVLAPFVEDGGAIEAEIAGQWYRWLFRGGRLYEVPGTTTYPAPTAEHLVEPGAGAGDA